MGTTCNNCGCSKPQCGCQDTMLTTPAPCPTPEGCPTPQPCSEVFDAQCIIYSGASITCTNDTVVLANTNLNDALNNIVQYFCTSTSIINLNIDCGVDTVIVAGSSYEEAFTDTVHYFCQRLKAVDDRIDGIDLILPTLQPIITLATVGTSGPATFVGNILNIPDYSSGGGSISGSGTPNYVARWTPTGSNLAESVIQDDGTSLGIGIIPNSITILGIDTALQGPFITSTKINTTAGQSAYGLTASSSGTNSLGDNIGVAGYADGNSNRAIGVVGNAANSGGNLNIGGYFVADNGVSNYSLQLLDGTETVSGGKFLRDMGDGKANWANIAASDIDATGITSGYVITADGAGNSSWQPSSGGGGGLSGSGLNNYVARWNPNSTTLTYGIIQDNGTTTSINQTLINAASLNVGTNGLTSATKWAIKCESINSSTGINYGIESLAENGALSNVGGNFLADTTTTDFAVGAIAGSSGISVSIGDTVLDGVNATSLGLAVSARANTLNPGNTIGGFYELLNPSANDNIGIFVKTTNGGAGNAYALALQDGTQGAGKLLTSDAEGRATWQNPNLQKEITATYVLTDADNDYVIFINNGATAITISIGAITIPNFSVGFIQEGTGDVTFTGATNPVGLKSKGQGYQTFIERKLNTSTYYLLGNTKV